MQVLAGTITAGAGAAAAGSRQHLAVQAGGGFGKPAEKKISKQKACPCGSGLEYKDCCQPYHAGGLPGTPEQLMRSRYSGYVKGLWQYIDDVLATIDKLGFERLKVLSVEPGKDEDEGFVTFQAWFKNRGQLGQRAQGWHTQTFVERSRFLREDGKWLYVDGEQDWKR
ncbi:hypothetical protein CHLNCDRAFT_137852 [Chlorella variabilis]|uniref:YchJ-like middle NTF2-like domain-containing protein n=1 Tax=Chlorella variabilis TaxID=554065 RepID=E1Z4N3_CHLVA|nr:hypothetical protein CHLNCDRAFT_137852 [Chlorella variabilis]EFN59379.1 hypothetical protein CHLNCDRAFT_137852 [Chlorella variabilis]|eukprot:XP_005851481.1 hypothetical protein CHLNCDRAFT_137852 [Chlorella variabilis]